jgi:hypothetical protein
MDSKLYLTIASVVAIIYAIVFVLIPGYVVLAFGAPPEVHVNLNLQFCGAALSAWGVILWFARDFQERAAVRGVLIGSVVGDVVFVLLNLWGILQGFLNALAWSSTIVMLLLLLGALYCLFTGSRRPA